MIPAWLFSEDGRPLWCVYVPVPMPRQLHFAGSWFAWDGTLRQYRRRPVYYAEAVPESERPDPAKPPKTEPGKHIL